MTEETRAGALRSLAATIRAGASARAALAEWHAHGPSELRRPLRALARRLELGAELPDAVGALGSSFGGDLPALMAVLTVHKEMGGDLAGMLDRLAGVIYERAAATAAARAAGAGARLSVQVVATLPLLLLLLAPSARAPLFDRTGMMLALSGAALCLGGLAWMRRLVPCPPEGDDHAALLGDLVAGAIAGGTSLHAALDAICRLAPEPTEPVLRARRLVALGASWSEALARCGDEGLRSLGGELRRAEWLGVPVASALAGLGARRRARRQNEFSASMRRAPVLMAMPLSFCVLPSYVLLGLAPFVRGFAG